MKRIFLASTSFIMFYLALFSSYIYEDNGRLRYARYILWLLGIICFLVSYTFKKDKETENKDQLRVIAGTAFIVQLLLLPSLNTVIRDRAIFALFAYTTALLLSITVFCIDFSYWKSLVRTRKFIVPTVTAIIIASACILYLRYNPVYFLWDSHSMYELISRNDVYSLLNFSELSLSEHVSYSYAAMCTIFKLLVGNAMMGQALFGFVLYALGVYGFYKCITLFSVDTDKSGAQTLHLRSTRFLLTILYACSPYMLGMITYSYPDYAMWCIMPILVYVLYTRKSLLVIFSGCFFIFCKETALITYVFLILGFYIIDVCRTKNIFYDFGNYVATTVPCIMWLISYLFVGHWQGSGAFTVDFGYIRDKLMSLLAINFNWALILVSLAIVIISIIKHKRCTTEISMLPMIISIVSFLIFSVLFKTINHPRYTDALISQIYLVTAYVLINYIEKESLRSTVSVALTVLMFIQSFKTIDPVMLKVFPNIEIGNTTMITTSESLSDGMAYNRQYQGWGKVVDAALEEVMTNEPVDVFLPAVGNVAWFFDAMGHIESLDESGETEYPGYWDFIRKTRMTDENDSTEYNVHVINTEYLFDPAQSGYYLYSPLFGNDIAEKIKAEYDYEEDTFNYKGWVVNRVKFGRT